MKNDLIELIVIVAISLAVCVEIYSSGSVTLNGNVYTEESNPIMFYSWLLFMASWSVVAVVRFFIKRNQIGK
jgi:hypothetical protein